MADRDNIFNFVDFKWIRLDVNLPYIEEHLFPFELIKTEKHYDLVIIHKYRIFQNDSLALSFECKTLFKTIVPIDIKFPIETLLDFVKQTLETSKEQLAMACVATNHTPALEYQNPPDDYLMKELIKSITSAN
jgi:hypothetical protein